MWSLEPDKASVFEMALLSVVEVAKRVSSLDGSISTTITARGYNTPGTGTGLAFCNTGNRLGKVERQFITYY